VEREGGNAPLRRSALLTWRYVCVMIPPANSRNGISQFTTSPKKNRKQRRKLAIQEGTVRHSKLADSPNRIGWSTQSVQIMMRNSTRTLITQKCRTLLAQVPARCPRKSAELHLPALLHSNPPTVSSGQSKPAQNPERCSPQQVSVGHNP
jgi:hypothetical protein